MTIQQTPTSVESTPLPTEGTEPVQETPEPAESIADHAEQFGPTREPANTGQFANKPEEVRHRSASQRATPEDVAEINRLTKELRETEQRVKDKDPDVSASPRIRTLKRQIAALKALEAPAPVAAPVKVEPAKPAPEPVKAGELSEKEPLFEDFQDTEKYPDPLAAWVKATARYENRRERWELSQEQAVQSAQTADIELRQAFDAKGVEFTKTKPDYPTVTAALMQQQIPDVLIQAIVRDRDNGPAFVYHLAQHPELVDDLFLLTYGKPVSDAFVATVQRRLSIALQQGQAASTGSATPQRTYQPPRPPNPVRTGPIKTTDDPPDEAASISEHTKYFGPKRR